MVIANHDKNISRMFDIGFIEIMIISMVALIVIGPERLPHVARTVGHLLGRLRRYVSSVKNDIQNEIRLDELRNMHASLKETTDSIESSVRHEIDQLKSMTDSNGSATPASPNSIETGAGSQSQADTVDALSKPQSQPVKSEEQQNDVAKNDNK